MFGRCLKARKHAFLRIGSGRRQSKARFESLECRLLFSVAPSAAATFIHDFASHSSIPKSRYDHPIPADVDGKVAPSLWSAVGNVEAKVANGAVHFTPGNKELANFSPAEVGKAWINESGEIQVFAFLKDFNQGLAAIHSLGLEARAVKSIDERG